MSFCPPLSFYLNSAKEAEEKARKAQALAAENAPLIICDIDETLVDKNTGALNRELCEQLRGQEIIILTNMDSREIPCAIAVSGYRNRELIFQDLQKTYDIRIKAVLTPYDISDDFKAGEAYTTLFKPLLKRINDKKLNLDNYTSDAEAIEAKKKILSIDEIIATIDPNDMKGRVLEKYLAASEQAPLKAQLQAGKKTITFYDDLKTCLESVGACCKRLGLGLKAFLVDIKNKTIGVYSDSTQAAPAPKTATTLYDASKGPGKAPAPDIEAVK